STTSSIMRHRAAASGTLPTVIRSLPLSFSGTGRLSLAEQQAAVLDGELVKVGAGFLCVDEPESPGTRAASLSTELFDNRVIVCDRSAGWVWGWGSIPVAVEVCVSISARVPSPERRRLHAREAVIDDSELAVLNGVRVTTPARTVTDLARHASSDDVIDLIVAAITAGDLSPHAALHGLHRRPGIAHVRRARRRIELALRRC
ncbi:MAG: hypothetical protein Q7J04_00940, partial [Microcella sp.]|nr:hypothetical protein [Microcella sp.]